MDRLTTQTQQGNIGAVSDDARRHALFLGSADTADRNAPIASVASRASARSVGNCWNTWIILGQTVSSTSTPALRARAASASASLSRTSQNGRAPWRERE